MKLSTAGLSNLSITVQVFVATLIVKLNQLHLAGVLNQLMMPLKSGMEEHSMTGVASSLHLNSELNNNP